MPELPDVMLYVERLEPRVVGQRLERVVVRSPFLVRTFDPPIESAEGKCVREIRRLGKRIVLGMDDELFLVLHLMIAGRLHWRPEERKAPAKTDLICFHFATGTLSLTEAGTKKRASLHVVRGEAALAAMDPGGIEVLHVDLDAFQAALRRRNRVLKRALTDPTVFSGIGNAYSDEILHRARLSPIALTQRLTDEAVRVLWEATRTTLLEWLARLREQAGDDFPERVTAFHPQMAVHGRHGQPCPVCKSAVQRIRYAESETNYCPRCQTGGKILADRSLSRLLKDDWPRSIEEWEAT